MSRLTVVEFTLHDEAVAVPAAHASLLACCPHRGGISMRPPGPSECSFSPAGTGLPALVRRSERKEKKMVTLTFPDGARREYQQGITGSEIAKGISPSLLKRTVAMALDGKLADLSDRVEQDAKVEFLSREDPRAL